MFAAKLLMHLFFAGMMAQVGTLWIVCQPRLPTAPLLILLLIFLIFHFFLSTNYLFKVAPAGTFHCEHSIYLYPEVTTFRTSNTLLDV